MLGRIRAEWHFWSAGCVILLLCCAPHAFSGWQRADCFFYDALTRACPVQPPMRKIAIVAVDDISLSTIGQWPWPRYRLAALIGAVGMRQPAQIGMDMLLPEPDRVSLREIRHTFQREFGLSLGFTGLPDGLDDNDAYLARMLRRYPVVGATCFLPDVSNTVEDSAPRPVRIAGAGVLSRVPAAAASLHNIPILQEALHASGFVNAITDADGTLRKAALLFTFQGAYYPSFGLALTMEYLHADALRVRSTFCGPVLEMLRGDACLLTIPVDDDGSMLLHFSNKEHHPAYLSALDMLQGKVDETALRDSICIIGATATGLNDMHNTPVANAFPGPEVHAVTVDNMLNSTAHRWPVWGTLYSLGNVVLVWFLQSLCFRQGAPRFCLYGCIGSISWTAGFPLVIFAGSAIYLPFAAPLACALLLPAIYIAERYVRERRAALHNLETLSLTRQLVMEAMASVAEVRSMEHDGHIRRTQAYVVILAEQLRRSGTYPEITPAWIQHLYHSAPLHDLGKVAIPDAVLLKPDKLNAEEFAIMQQHTLQGQSIINSVRAAVDEDNFLQDAADVAVAHHEKWDGSGYPLHLKGMEIPLSARIMALADVYDALVSKRRYKKAFPHAEARRIIVEGSGTHFDPAIVAAFLAEEEKFKDTASRYADVTVPIA